MPTDDLATPSSPSDVRRALELKWRNAPPGMSPAMAEECMANLKAGSTVRKLTLGLRQFGAGIVSYARFKKHCELHPEWACDAWQISKANSSLGRGFRFTNMTRCKHGHSLADAYVSWQQGGYIKRDCRTCVDIRHRRGGIVKPEVITQITSALRNGATTSQICHGRPKGGGRVDRSLKMVDAAAFYRYRRENPDFDRFVVEAINSRISYRDTLKPPGTFRYDWHPSDPTAIAAMLPDSFAGKDDVLQSIFLALIEGQLDRSQIQKHLRHFVSGYHRQHPTKFAKFGNSLLVSLDEVLFDDGRTTRGDNVSRGLWD
jgi:hypothetical protein